jgi:hypothetical protein
VFILLLFLNTTFENSFGYSRNPGRTRMETSLGKQDKIKNEKIQLTTQSRILT